MHSSGKDFLVWKSLVWSACHKLLKVRKSNLSGEIKKWLFLAIVELVLLFGSEKLNILTGAHEHLMVKDPHEHLMVMDAHEHLMVTGAHEHLMVIGAHEHLMVMDAHEHFMVTGAHEHHMGIKTDKPITTWNITNNFA